MIWLLLTIILAHVLTHSRRSTENAALVLTLVSMLGILWAFLFSGFGGLIPSLTAIGITFVVRFVVNYIYLYLLAQLKNKTIPYALVLIGFPLVLGHFINY